MELPKLITFRSMEVHKAMVATFPIIEAFSKYGEISPDTAIVVDESTRMPYVDKGKHLGTLFVNSRDLPKVIGKIREFIDGYKSTGDIKQAADLFIGSLSHDDFNQPRS